MFCVFSASLTFVSVHDCYWTHALTVDIMNKVCPKQGSLLFSAMLCRSLCLLGSWASSDPPVNPAPQFQQAAVKLVTVPSAVQQLRTVVIDFWWPWVDVWHPSHTLIFKPYKMLDSIKHQLGLSLSRTLDWISNVLQHGVLVVFNLKMEFFLNYKSVY